VTGRRHHRSITLLKKPFFLGDAENNEHRGGNRLIFNFHRLRIEAKQRERWCLGQKKKTAEGGGEFLEGVSAIGSSRLPTFGKRGNLAPTKLDV